MGLYSEFDHASERVQDSPPRDLLLPDEVVKMATRSHEETTLLYVPKLRYWACDDGRKMSHAINYCGHQQRAFDYYWCLRAFEQGRIAVSIGAGAIGSPNCLSTDKYNGVSPHAERYGTEYGFSAMHVDADKPPLPFFDRQFGAVMMNHSFEHLADQETALGEALRICAVDGRVCIVMPDMTFNQRGSIDPTHTREWAADEFLQWLRDRAGAGVWPPFVIEEHNTFDNDFSFNTVLRRV